MKPAVKICGLSTRETLAAALSAGAAFIGFVHYPKSPRHVTIEMAARLADEARGVARVTVLSVDPDDALLERIAAEVRPDFLQLHGAESPERVHAISRRFGVPAIKAIKVATTADVRSADAYRGIAAFPLFDAKVLSEAPGLLPGGNGIAFDWHALEGEALRGPFMLSGGLTPGNVAEAVKLTAAPMVDVSSGVEAAPGVKNSDLIRRFIAAAHSQAQEIRKAQQ